MNWIIVSCFRWLQLTCSDKIFAPTNSELLKQRCQIFIWICSPLFYRSLLWFSLCNSVSLRILFWLFLDRPKQKCQIYCLHLSGKIFSSKHYANLLTLRWWFMHDSLIRHHSSEWYDLMCFCRFWYLWWSQPNFSQTTQLELRSRASLTEMRQTWHYSRTVILDLILSMTPTAIHAQAWEWNSDLRNITNSMDAINSMANVWMSLPTTWLNLSSPVSLLKLGLFSCQACCERMVWLLLTSRTCLLFVFLSPFTFLSICARNCFSYLILYAVYISKADTSFSLINQFRL